jgi:hypothetical protein
MTIRAADFPDLRLNRIEKLMKRFTTPPTLRLMTMFGQDNWDSDHIKYRTQIGNRGMTPFVAPGVPSPLIAPVGVGESEAYAAFWKEKMFFDEQLLNNLADPANDQVIEMAQKRIARETMMLRNRCERRKEWMFAKMLTAGTITYKVQNGLKWAMSYGIPSDNIVDLGASLYWDDGVAKNIVNDVLDAKLAISNANGGALVNMLLTTEILNIMLKDPGIQALTTKSAFSTGQLFATPVPVLGALLGMPNIMIYDEQYQVKAWLTAAVTGSSTVSISVDDATDFEVGDTLYFYDVSAGTKEGETISAVDVNAGTITVSTAPTASFKSGEDYVYVTKKYIPTTTVTLFCNEIEGEPIAEFANAPFGLGRNYGMKVDDHEEWDPDGIAIRVQNKGIPVLYQEDAVYILTVKD